MSLSRLCTSRLDAEKKREVGRQKGKERGKEEKEGRAERCKEIHLFAKVGPGRKGKLEMRRQELPALPDVWVDHCFRAASDTFKNIIKNSNNAPQKTTPKDPAFETT